MTTLGWLVAAGVCVCIGGVLIGLHALHVFDLRGIAGRLRKLDRALWRARLRALLGRLWRLLGQLWHLVYPPTKRKLHRLLHVLGVSVTGALMALAWTATNHRTWLQHIGATLAPLVPLLTSWRASLGWAEKQIAASSLPDDDAVPIDDSQLEDTGVHGRGDLGIIDPRTLVGLAALGFAALCVLWVSIGGLR